MEGEFHKNGLYRFLCFRGYSGVLGVIESAFSEAEARQEPEVEILSNLQVGDHIEVEAGAIEAFNANDGITEDKVFTTKGGIPTGVKTKGKTEVEPFVLKVVEVIVVTAGKLGAAAGAKEYCEEQCEYYFSAV